MGLNKSNGSSGGNILHVKRGAICLESSEAKEGYERVEGDVDGNPYEKWVLKNGSVDGMITGTYWYDTGDEQPTRYQGLKVHIDDGDEQYMLDLPFGKGPYDNFTKFAENIDFEQTVEFVAFPDKDRPTSTVLAAKQDGKIIRQKYTKNNLGDCPPAVENKRTGKWNFDEQRDWLLDNLVTRGIVTMPATEEEEEMPTHTGKPAKPAAKAKAKAAADSSDRWADVEDPIHV